MKAHVLYGINDLRYEDVEKPNPGRGEVLVKVEAVGICGSDIPRIFETGAHNHPLIPGHEFAGTVCAGGKDTHQNIDNIEDINKATIRTTDGGQYIENTHEMKRDKREDALRNPTESWLGKRVGVFPLIPCGKCGPCLNKQYEMCRNYNYLGSRCDGGFAEYVKVPVKNLIELPDNVSFDDAAMLEPTAVSVHAMIRMIDSSLSPDEKVLRKNVVVIGLGTIGLLLTMNLVAEGFDNIFVIGNKKFQYEKAKELSISPENYCDSTATDPALWLMSKTNGNGADYIFECVGKNDTYKQAVEMASPKGRVMLVGNPASDMQLGKNTYWKILRNQLSVIGTWNSSFTGEIDDDWHYAINGISSGDIKPSKLISHKLKLDELQNGLHIMKDKTEDYVKVMVYS